MADEVQDPVNTARTNFTVIPDAKQAGEIYVALPKGNTDGWEVAHSRQTILVEPQALYELWKDELSFPLWMENVISVTPTAGKQSHWVMGNPEDPDAKRVEFDSEIFEDVPGEKIAWKTIGGDVEQDGQVTFKARRDGRGTVVTLIQRVKIGVIAAATASIAKRGAKQTVIEDLRHFKQMAEAGEIPSVKGQPHGPRGVTGGLREWMLGETNPTPPGTSEGPL
jgi:uncharacterized membrane protein